MPVYYLDTSALFKRYHTERGSELITELFGHRVAEDRFTSSYLAVLEVEAAASRALRGGRLTLPAYRTLLSHFNDDLTRNLVILQPITNALLNDAVAWTRRHALRAGDAVHFAAGMLVRRAAGGDAVDVTSDAELVAAAGRERFACIDPESEGSLEVLRSYRSTLR